MTHTLSFSQFGELLDIDPAKIAAVTLDASTRTIAVEESEPCPRCGVFARYLWREGSPICTQCGLKELDMSQTSGAFPALTKDGKTINGKPKKGKKR